MTEIKVFSKEWFKKYNKAITWVARLPILGELIFNFKKYGHYVDRKKLCEVTPNSVVEYLGMKGEKAELRQHFFVRNEYALRLQKVFYPIWITFHIWDIITRPIPQLNLGFDTLTVYPDYHPESTSVDGYVGEYNLSGNTWSYFVGASGNTFNDSSTSEIYGTYIQGHSTTDKWVRIYRGIFLFDTSALGSGATISSATLSLYGIAKIDTASFAPDINIYSSNPASNVALENGDYDSLGSTAFSTTITYANFNDAGYNDFALNGNSDPSRTLGLAAISKTGISKFGTRNASYDVANTAPTWAEGYALLDIKPSNSTGNKPKLVVTYTLAVTFIPRTMWFN